MAYQNNNNYEKPTVVTRSYKTSNANAIKATAFEWDYSNDMVKMLITDELPENEITEKRRYDYEHSWVTYISRLKCLDLIKQVKNIISPALKAKENKFVSVPLAEVNQFGIGVAFDENGNCRSYVKLIRNLDPKTLTSSAEIIYEFRTGEVLVDFDNKSGKLSGRILDQTELSLFLLDLENFVNASSKAYNHANRVVDKSYKDMIADMLKAIGNKVGANLPTYNQAQRAGAKYGQTSLFSNAEPAPSDVITTLDELELPFE